MGYHAWCWCVRGIGLLGGSSIFLGIIVGNNVWLYSCGIILLVAGLIVSAWKLRCPKCNRRIPERVNMKIERCPYCGEKL